MSFHSHFFVFIYFFISFGTLFGVIDFSKQVLPILEERCIECHKAPFELNGKIKEPKAGLRLDGAAHIMYGGDGGPVVVADHPSQSSLYQRVLLPLDDSEHMPPKGNPLTFKQKEVLRKWIAQGLDFGKWVGKVDGVEKLAKKNRENHSVFIPEHITLFNKLSDGLQPLPQDELDRIASSSQLMIRAIGIGNPLLEARVVTNPELVDDFQITKLGSISKYLTKLDLRNTRITDRSLIEISGFSKLTELNLRGTGIGNSNLANLAHLPVLRTLNLCETQVSDKGLKPLNGIKSLEQVFLWNSQVSLKGQLRSANIFGSN